MPLFIICKPPIFTKQYGVLVTSTNRAGSQNEIGTPILGTGFVHVQISCLGLGVSSPLAETLIPPIVIGNIQLQQISEMGLTNLPTHLLKASFDVTNTIRRM
jgi:hypothetical protein